MKKKWVGLGLMLGLATGAWGAYEGTGTFSKITNRADLTEAYYVVANRSGLFAMTHTNAGSFFMDLAIAPESDVLTDPSPAIVWHIQTHAAYDGLTIYNEASNRYVAYAGTANAAHSVAEVNDATGVWSFAWREDIGCFAASNGALPYRFLQYNAGAPRFSCYSNGTLQHLTLYRLTTQTPAFTGGAGPYGATTGVAVAFAVAASGIPPPVLALESTTATGGYSFTPETGILDYLPPPDDGDATQTFVFVASNEHGVATQAVEVVVVSSAAPEFAANPGPLAATTGVAVAFAVAASGIPPPVLALESTTATGGYSFTPETGILDYLPPPDDGDATQTFVFAAGNWLGAATQTVEVAVEFPPPAPPEFGANPGPLAATTGVAMAFAVSASGIPPPVLALESTTATGGYTFAPETGILDYLPPWKDGGATQAFVFAAGNASGTARQTVEVAVARGAPPQVITAAQMAAGNQTRLEWPADTGLVYRVETTTDLNEPVVWSNATPEGLVFSNATGVCELPADGPRRFYRFAADESTPTDLYMVVDLSGGPEAANYPVSYLNAVPPDGWTDEYKTTKLVMRRIPAGTFTMGSPTNELGRYTNEPQHQVTLTKDFYIGVFEVTQKQWERVMGNWPSYFANISYRETRPVERVTYYEIRENPANSAISPNWPQSSQVHAESFMGRLRAKTGLATFDLPTEAQWEYACRAGTTTALNSGKNLTGTESCPNMAEVGRYHYNHPGGYSSSSSVTTDGGTTKVGSYLPNAWGLYDMHGNVWEWCLDWYVSAPAGALDPPGADSGSLRVLRGGGWNGYAGNCRSAYRRDFTPGYRSNGIGFRPSRTLP